LKKDLIEWNQLYLAGRLHKPILILRDDVADLQLQDALRQNLQSALSVALFCLPQTFDEKQLYMAITKLSYQGLLIYYRYYF